MRVALFALVAVPFAFAGWGAGSSQEPPVKKSAPGTLTGRVLETIDAGQYTYLRLQTAEGEAWAAVPTTKQKAGNEVTVVSPIWMQDFKSNSLNRTWPRIAFGTLQTGASEGPGAAGLPPGHPDPRGAKDLGPIKVAKAPGPQGRTVADVWAQRAQLKDKPVAVRGKVVKATNGVMGKNWLHLRDGTGQGETSDLTVTTDGSAEVGATVLVSGTVKLDRDLGAGYHYDVLVEDARIEEKK